MINDKNIAKLIQILEGERINMHSLLIMEGNKLICEAYWKPYTAISQHRMFSISKSFTAIAIGLLQDEGKLSIDDRICDYFPEYVPQNVHPWIANMTIRDCLMMRTCHASTTYKINMQSDWVESFFTTAPTHPSGRFFHYDTSSTHTLCALVEKLSGMKMLDYIKTKLASVGFSKESYMIPDPFGVSMGGSGLVATPMDMLKFGCFLKNRGMVDGQQLLSASYIDECTSFLSDTRMTAPIPSEAVGYGMQIWRNEKGSWVCYGMGGQFIINLPDLDVLVVTTADTIGRAGANQIIYNAIYSCLYNIEETDSKSTNPGCDISVKNTGLKSIIDSLHMHPEVIIPGTPGPEALYGNTYFYNRYIAGKNFKTFDTAFDNFSLSLEKEVGTLSYTLNGKECVLNFGFGNLIEGQFPVYDMHYAASAAWVTPDTLYIRFHIIDEYIGSVHMELTFTENDVTIFMKKNEESLFAEYNCHIYGSTENN